MKAVSPSRGKGVIDVATKGTRVELGVIEFHSERKNPGLIERFYAVADDLKASGSIVDLWLMDIATVLKEFGYDMQIYRLPPSPQVEPKGRPDEKRMSELEAEIRKQASRPDADNHRVLPH